VGDRLAGIRGDPDLELLEVIGHGLVFLAGDDRPHILELEPETAAGQMGAEDVKNGCSREHSQIDPDGQEAVVAAQQPARPGVRAGPGDVSADVEAQAILHHRAGSGHDLDRLDRLERSAEEEVGLRMDIAGCIEEAVQSR
jgi:hypothetical protein